MRPQEQFAQASTNNIGDTTNQSREKFADSNKGTERNIDDGVKMQWTENNRKRMRSQSLSFVPMVRYSNSPHIYYNPNSLHYSWNRNQVQLYNLVNANNLSNISLPAENTRKSNIDNMSQSESPPANKSERKNSVDINMNQLVVEKKLKAKIEKHYHCKICNKSYKTKGNLQRHLNSHEAHEEQINPKKKRKLSIPNRDSYKMDVCSDDELNVGDEVMVLKNGGWDSGYLIMQKMRNGNRYKIIDQFGKKRNENKEHLRTLKPKYLPS
eukprot:243902_1